MSRFLSLLKLLLCLLLALSPAGAQAPADATPPPVPANGAGPVTPPVSVTLPKATAPTDPQAAMERALIAYKAEVWDDAFREFKAIVESGPLSAALAHNLGNVEYRRGNPGQAVLWYRRALALQPFSPETVQNLRAIRKQAPFLSFDSSLLLLSYLKPRWIFISTIVLAWLSGLLVIWLAWATPKPGRRWPLVTLLGGSVPLLCLGLLLSWNAKSDPVPLAQRQIISGKETVACAAPAEASSAIITLPAGSEVVPLETRGNWVYCLLPGGEDDAPLLRGWVRAVKLEPLWPWPAQF